MFPPPGFDPAVEDVSPAWTTSAAVVASTVMSLATAATPTIANAVSTATSITSSSDSSDSDNGECRLLGPFALFVQGGLGALALLSLVYKRWRERPQRPLKIWFFDVSKQVVGSVLVHMANLLISMISPDRVNIGMNAASAVQTAATIETYTPNPCSLYLLNLGIDTTLGVPILIFLLRLLTAFFALTPVGVPRESIESGNYGNPPRVGWWFKQCMIFFIGLMGMKICVLIIFVVFPWISRVGDWALGWTEGNETVQIVFVMLLFPLIMNIVQYYIVDTYIMHKTTDDERLLDDSGSGEYIEARDSDDYDEHSGSSDEINSGDEDDDEDDLAEDVLKLADGPTNKKSNGNLTDSKKQSSRSHSRELTPSNGSAATRSAHAGSPRDVSEDAAR